MKVFYNFFQLIRKIIFINKDYNKKYLYFLLFLFTIITSLTEIITLGSLLPLIDTILNLDNYIQNKYVLNILNFFNLDKNNLTNILFLTFGSMLIISFSLKSFTIWLLAYLTNDISYYLSRDVFNKTLSQNYNYYLDTNTSVFMGNIEKVDMARAATFALLQMMVSLIISSFITLFVLTINFFSTSILIICFLFVYGVMFYLVKKKITKISILDSFLINNKFKFLAECNDNIKVIILKKLKTLFGEKFSEIMLGLRTNRIKSQVYTHIPGQVVILIASLLLLLLIYYYFKAETLFSNIAFLGMLILAVQRLIPQVQHIYVSLTTLKQFQYSFYDISNALELKEDDNITYSKKINLFEKFEIKNLSFTHNKSEIELFTNSNLKFETGKIYSLKGKSGLGKSTLLDIIMGLYNTREGSFLLDGKEFTPFQNYNWQKIISFVPQNSYLIDGSILENITYGTKSSDIDNSRVEECAKTSEIFEFLKKTDSGLNTFVGERGIKISGGQKQRISLARALYGKSQILLLDEATNALDQKIENKILENLKSIKLNKIIIIINHHSDIDKFVDVTYEIRNKTISLIDIQN